MSGIGALLKRHRIAAGLTQEELAGLAGLSTRSISDIERGLRTSVYRDTAGRLASALGLDGEPRRVFDTAARGRSEGPASVVLPAQPTRLIGREREVDVVLAALRDPAVRLLTLTGPGGIGKTRVAVEAARRSTAEYPEGVFFVSLGGTSDPRMVVPNVGSVLGVVGRGCPPKEAIAEHLGAARTLIVLDTFEHVMDAAAEIGELLAICPGLVALATSREALHLRGEHEVAVPALETPASGAPLDLDAYPATALFVERARAVDPSFAVDDDASILVAEVCEALNGLPLAIELAAARVKHLPLPALRDLLEDRLRLLTGGPRDLPRRQQTMRDTVAWSYDLLEPSEASLLRALSIFAGGWTLDAATEVCVPTGGEALASMSALVDKSVVVRTEERYGMLDVIREFATEERDARGESAALERRHAEYFLLLAEETEPQLGKASQAAAYARLEAERSNLRSALGWSIGLGEADIALRLAAALWQFWRVREGYSEGRTWLERALSLDRPGSTPVRSKALWGAAWLAYHQTDYDTSERLGRELLALARADGGPFEKRNGLTIQGMVATARGREAEAVAALREGLELLRPLPPNWLLATSLMNLGVAATRAGDAAEGEALLEESLALYRKLGDEYFCARCIGELGYTALIRGDLAAGRSLLASGLAGFRALGDQAGIAEELEGLATVDAAAGDAERAARIAGAAAAIRATIESRPLPFDAAITERFLDEARASVGDARWTAAFEEGKTMPLDEALDDALEVPGG